MVSVLFAMSMPLHRAQSAASAGSIEDDSTARIAHGGHGDRDLAGLVLRRRHGGSQPGPREIFFGRGVASSYSPGASGAIRLPGLFLGRV